MDVLTHFASSGGLSVFLFAWVCVLSIVVYRQAATNRSLLGGKKRHQLKDIVLEQMGKVGELQMEVAGVSQRFGEVVKAYNTSIQKVGLVRFSAFEDTGGDQSFVIALLDADDSGIVLSSLHGREHIRMYAKAVKGGKSAGHALSEEEQAAIQHAMQVS